MFTKRREECPLCGSSDLKSKYRIERYSIPFETEICGTCGFIFINPLFDEATISGFYSEDYYKGRADYSYVDEREIKKYSSYVWNSRIKVLRRFAPSGNFLDVGCSFGGFLESAAPYYTAYGIELSDYSARYARTLIGDRVHCGTLKDHPFQNDFFSVITMIELIEHLPDPAEAIRESYRLLKKNGVLLIQTANMDGLQAKGLGSDYEYYMPGHLSYFSRRNLLMALESAGFRKVKVFQPVEFGLLPKLMKSRGSFKSASDYRAWLRITSYHLKSMVHFGDFALTSSMVIYAVK